MDPTRLTAKVIGCAYTVSNSLGCGFLEAVYENALAHEIQKHGLSLQRQSRTIVRYDGIIVGDYVADLVVEGSLIVELKAVSCLDKVHFAQCMNYLKATGLKTCLLINFGRPKVQVRRLNNHFHHPESIPIA